MSLVGRHIGRYRILEQLGQGGMSIVYKGFDTSLDREVAVKVLHPHLASKEESRKRLAREAKAVARLHHPNILEVFDFAGQDTAEAYIVTEYIRGKTLRQFMQDEAFEPPEIAAMVVHELAAALAHAHESGVMHRDLKPENAMVREDGVIKLMDFGIAKIIDRNDKMTMTGALVGSPAHMAPEIVEGEESGPEADVFSLGTMLYLFSTGKLPFAANNTTATLKKILDCNYDDPRQLSPALSDELCEIITTCLSRQPADRYPQAGPLQKALGDCLRDVGLARPTEELKAFFIDPHGYREELKGRLAQARLSRARALVAEKRHAKALAALNLIFAHDPQNAEAKALLLELRTAKQRADRLRRAVRAGRSVALLGLFVLAGFAAWAGLAPKTLEPAALPVPPPLVEGPPAALIPAVDPAEPAPPTTAAVTPTPAPAPTPVERPTPAVSTGSLTVQIRPWGYLAVDGQPRSKDELSLHRFSLKPGAHTITITCELCDEKGRTQNVVIKAGEEKTLSLAAPLKPSLVRFTGIPDDVSVQIGAETRTGAEAKNVGFKLLTPPEGSHEAAHPFTYEVLRDGHTVAKATLRAVPGKPVLIEEHVP